MFKLLRPRAKSLSSKGAGGSGGSVEKLVLCRPPRSAAGSPRQKQGKNKSNFCGSLFMFGSQLLHVIFQKLGLPFKKYLKSTMMLRLAKCSQEQTDL